MTHQIIMDLNTRIHDRVFDLLRSERRGPLLDIGAGDGTLALRLRDDGFDVRAVDLTAKDFRAGGIDITCADLNDGIPFSDHQFAVVVATEVIEHLENPWFFVRELYRITEPGGIVVVSTPNLSNVFTRGWYALTGRLYNFLDSAYQDIGHITPVHLWNLERMIQGKFDLEAVTVNASPVPKTRLMLPTRSRLFGQCIIAKLRRLAGPPTAVPRVWMDSRIVRAHSS
ncbi:MAG TPA: class I SAM-dependent methyltransferase [Actinomycetota bacterium]|nr:class I SAM-dependent methyltransferase [Actinomycetota bacterium]